jgi:hypothetical protein
MNSKIILFREVDLRIKDIFILSKKEHSKKE